MRNPKALPILFAAATTGLSSATVHAGMTLELRATGGSGGVGVVNPKLVDVSEAQPGDIVTFDIIALITGKNANPNDEGFTNVYSSFLSDNAGAVRGNMVATVTPLYRASGASNGFSQDLDSDGDFDIGSNVDGSATNFFHARHSSVEPAIGQLHTIGTLTMTLTQIPKGVFGSTVNCRPRIATVAGAWFEDGSATGTAAQGPSAIGIGAPVILSDVPEPGAIGLVGITAAAMFARRRDERRC
jgi:hypothetical protein